MIFRVAHNGDSNAEASGGCAFWDGVDAVIGALGVNVWAQILQQGLDVGLGEEHDVIDSAQSADQRGSRRFGQDWAPNAFECGNAVVRIHGDDENVAFAAGTFQISSMTYVQSVEATVGQDDFLAALAVLGKAPLKMFTRDDFGFSAAHRL